MHSRHSAADLIAHNLIVILDGNADRRRKMVPLVQSIRPDLAIHEFDNAPDLLAALPRLLPTCVMFSLDHDLGPSRERNGARFDPGIGRQITMALARWTPVCPVIVHTSNAVGAEEMISDLQRAEWTVERVVPRDELKWIGQLWLPVVGRLIGDSG